MLFKRDIISYKTKANSKEIVQIQMRLKNMNQIEFSLEELTKVIERGSSFYLCQFKENGSVSLDNTLGTEYIGIDCDNKDKDHIITLENAIELIKAEFQAAPKVSYYTFSSSDIPKFRLIYKLDKFITPDEFRRLYNVLILTINKDHEVIDTQASNCNRLWAGTNKGVQVYDNVIPFNTEEIMSRLPKFPEKKKVPKIDNNKNNYIYKDYYIKKQYRSMIRQQLIEEISVQDYLESHFGARIKNRRCNCVVHGGDNKSALAIYDKSCYCFTRCGHMSVVDLAKNYLGISDDNEVMLRLLKEYNITFNLNAIERRR